MYLSGSQSTSATIKNDLIEYYINETNIIYNVFLIYF